MTTLKPPAHGTVEDDPTGYRPFPRKARDEGSEYRLARWATAYQVVGWVLFAPGAILSLLGLWNWFRFTNTNSFQELAALTQSSAIAWAWQLGFGFAFLGMGGSALFFGALLAGATDVIRLLKRSNNLPYSGEIAL